MLLRLLGRNRLINVIALVTVTVGIWVAAFSLIQPHYDEVSYEFDITQQRSMELRTEIEKIENITRLMIERGAEYMTISDIGVREEQDRVTARRIIQDTKFSAEIPFLQYSISGVQEKTNADINNKGYKLYQSNIVFEINAYTSRDIFNFIEELEDNFDGHIVLKEMGLSKTSGMQQQMEMGLNATSSRPEASLLFPRIDGKIEFVWNSLQKSEEQMVNDDFMGTTDF